MPSPVRPCHVETFHMATDGILFFVACLDSEGREDSERRAIELVRKFNGRISESIRGKENAVATMESLRLNTIACLKLCIETLEGK